MQIRTLPVIDGTTRPFWEATRQGRLLLQRCPKTGRYQWYPRPFSIHAPGVRPEWVEASGHGTIFSFSVIHRGNGPKRPPYNVALIALDEGVLMLSAITGLEEADLAIGLPVEVGFEPVSDEISLPVFRRRLAV